MITFIAECKREKEKFKTLAKKNVQSDDNFDKHCLYAVDFANILDYFAECAKKRVPGSEEEIINIYKWHIRRYVDYLNSL
ncbi:hypothetical protein GCM10007424_05740 [Flavobacterium suaedae]|uniref:Uncharacterized protein n=1 Tax=Flavobacterium suaedae TaxID=1767027 RepID=A0ABQ1JJU0_9FLAO|nr:hypothetical protein [Flavobacterium suaedae]GGB68579.1 hypothetical protein GCM10007424_05740 [Flavobacterium suaedae]